MEKKEQDILEEIRDCYNNGLLSALVGAGFSKNVSDSFLGWGELLHDMIGELYETDIKRNYDNYLHQSYGVITDPKTKETPKEEYISEICKNEDYLELVSKYIQKKGIKESLEIYIESRIPYVAFNEEGKITLKIGNKEKEQISDTKFSAHKELLLLNKLQNIDTTNYENLIEFTINLLGLGIKDSPKIVLSGRDLSDNIRNRNIIKIHGNLRQELRGKIYGDDNRKEWSQLIVTKVTYAKKWWKTYTYVTKNHFYNPVKQSVGHVFRVKELLSAYPHLKIVSIVVFAGDANLSNVESNHHVIYEESLLDVIDEYKTTYITDNDVQAVLAILTGNNIRKTVSDSQHVKNIRKATKEVNAAINSGICPKCGGHLIERNGKYGTFYGCSNYPKCRFTTQ